MDVDARSRALFGALESGLDLVERPFAALGRKVGLAEDEVLERIGSGLQQGVLSRFGIIVRHRRLGYRANAMVVWNVPDRDVDAVGKTFSTYPFVTLCYRRPRRLPDWPYNLFSMIHGKERHGVEEKVSVLDRAAGQIPHAILFSRQCFKQTAARYGALEATP